MVVDTEHDGLVSSNLKFFGSRCTQQFVGHVCFQTVDHSAAAKSEHGDLGGYASSTGDLSHAYLTHLMRHLWYLHGLRGRRVRSLQQASDHSPKADVASKLLSTPRPEEFEMGGNQPVVLGVDHHEILTDLTDEDSWLVFSALWGMAEIPIG